MTTSKNAQYKMSLFVKHMIVLFTKYTHVTLVCNRAAPPTCLLLTTCLFCNNDVMIVNTNEYPGDSIQGNLLLRPPKRGASENTLGISNFYI